LRAPSFAHAHTGAVHECLRKSWDHLSAECKAAEEGVEKLEHEDVRLNPKIQK
jgi:golgi apparatus protein 1